MSGNTSQRQWMPWRVRTLLAVLLALGMLIPVVSAFAQDEAVRPNDKLCIEGSVIDWEEYLLDSSNNDPDVIDPWTINYAPYVGTQAEQPAQVQTKDGKFKIESYGDAALSVGLWNFSIVIPQNTNWEGVTPTSFDVPLNYGSDQCAQIRFKLVRRVPVIVTKINDAHEPLKGWVMRAAPGKGNWFASPVEVTTDANGEAQFRLTPGLWAFTERAPHGVPYMAIMPSSGRQELHVAYEVDDAGAPVVQRIRFKNRVTEYGCIDVYKLDVPPVDAANSASTPLPGWKMTVKRANGTVVATGYTDASGKVTFSHLPFGPYTVVEEHRTGWAPASPTGFTVDVTTDDPCSTVTFFNEQDFGFSFVGRKIDTNGKVGLPNWKIRITPLDKGGALPENGTDDPDHNNTKYVLTDGLGQYRFDFATNDYRVPGARYQICEEEVAGWLPHTPLCYTVRLPHDPGSPVKVWDFENQQVGHWETVIYGRPSTSTGACAHSVTVQPGDSLYGIGAYYGVSASAMLAANPWVYSRPHYYVYPGDTVCVP